MAISHEVFVAPPALLELLIAADQSQTDAYVASNDGADDSDESSADETWFEGDALLDALLELNGTEDVVDMWRLGDDVGTLLNVPLGYDDVFWAMGRSLYDMTYIEPSLVAEFSRRLGSECEPARWYDTAVTAGTSIWSLQHRRETEDLSRDVVALIHRAAGLDAGLIIWHSA
jgi:hypothetical protein